MSVLLPVLFLLLLDEPAVRGRRLVDLLVPVLLPLRVVRRQDVHLVPLHLPLVVRIVSTARYNGNMYLIKVYSWRIMVAVNKDVIITG